METLPVSRKFLYILADCLLTLEGYELHADVQKLCDVIKQEFQENPYIGGDIDAAIKRAREQGLKTLWDKDRERLAEEAFTFQLN